MFLDPIYNMFLDPIYNMFLDPIYNMFLDPIYNMFLDPIYNMYVIKTLVKEPHLVKLCINYLNFLIIRYLTNVRFNRM